MTTIKTNLEEQAAAVSKMEEFCTVRRLASAHMPALQDAAKTILILKAIRDELRKEDGDDDKAAEMLADLLQVSTT
jgi:hypothetical protein